MGARVGLLKITAFWKILGICTVNVAVKTGIGINFNAFSINFRKKSHNTHNNY